MVVRDGSKTPSEMGRPAPSRHPRSGRHTKDNTLLRVEAPGSSPGGFFVSGRASGWGGTGGKPAQDRRQDPAAEVVLDVDRTVEPGDGREPTLGAVVSCRGHRHRLLRRR